MSAIAPLPPIEFATIDEGVRCDGFRCSNREINNWFKKLALKKHTEGSARVTCAIERENRRRPLGFFALATVAEEVSNLPGRYHPFRKAAYFSALQLVWLATDKGFEGRGLGEIMVGQVIRLFAQVGPLIGLPHLIVTPALEDHKRLTTYYSRLGFTPYKDGEAMFLPLQSAVEATTKIITELADEAVPETDPNLEGN